MQEFYQEIKDRKALVPSARRRVGGSKSKKCSLPHDKITPSQWKKMNGGTTVYNLKEPMSWSEFKKLPQDLSEQYIQSLKDKYAINGATLAECWGISQSTLCSTFKEKGVKAGFTNKKRPTFEQKAAALRFFSGEEKREEQASPSPLKKAVPTVVDVDRSISNVTVTSQDKPVEAQKMKMPRVSVQFDGPFDPEAFINSVKYLIPEGEQCTIDLSVLRAG